MFRAAVLGRFLVVALPSFLAAVALLGPGQAGGGKGMGYPLLVAKVPVPIRDADFPRKIMNSIGMKLVRIPPGTFQMGSPVGEEMRSTDEDQHEVEITKDFWLGVHEVTQKQFKAVMGFNPSFFSTDGKGKAGEVYNDDSQPAGGKDKVAGKDTDAFPVENVSWDEAVEFCKKLSARAAEAKCGRVYRLPTEAEWEYACRGGGPSYQVFHFGNSLSCKQANFYGPPYGGATAGGSLERTCKVGSYSPNSWGLYDMHGNVWEWCSDWYDRDYYGKSPRRDPQGPSTGSSRVVRGGGWGSTGHHTRSALRFALRRSWRLDASGFRVALVPVSR
jgi:formylglycine-generating enzyme required for sulfatase activity